MQGHFGPPVLHVLKKYNTIGTFVIQWDENKAPSTLIRFQTKTELFCSVFKKICVHTYRFRIVFARPHYNALSVWKRFYTLSAHIQVNSAHAHFNISAREIGAILDSLLLLVKCACKSVKRLEIIPIKREATWNRLSVCPVVSIWMT